jgi:DNA repair and recombination RAD54-like protein
VQVNQFILRRTNTLLSKHLPPKLVQIVCIRLTPLQEQLYRHFMDSKAMLMMLCGGKQTVRRVVSRWRTAREHIRQRCARVCRVCCRPSHL